MLLNSPRSLFAVAVVTIAMVLASCVDIPDKAPDPPALNAEYRFLSVLPDSVTAPASIKMADGPNFTSYASIALGANTVPTNYATYFAGSKRVVYGALDTFRLTFETDQRGTIAFYQTKAGAFNYLKLPYRYIFAPNGLQDTTLVRFTNLVTRAQDTIDVYRSDTSLTAGLPVVANNILLGATSAVVKIPAGKKYNFFITDPANQNKVFKDSVVITGASRKIYTVFVYDRYDSSGANIFLKTQNVKVKVLEEL